MFLSDFALVVAYNVKARDRRVWIMLCLVNVKMDIDWVPVG